jgi:hypothetical protein
MKSKPFWDIKLIWLIGLFAILGGGAAGLFVKPAESADRIAAMLGGLLGGALVGLVLAIGNKKKRRR